jgi:hypothetical protein
LLLLVEERRLRLRFGGETNCRLLLCISGGTKEPGKRKKALGLQLLVWIGCSRKLRVSGEKEDNRGRDRSAEKQLAASMKREQAERGEWQRLERGEREVEMREYLRKLDHKNLTIFPGTSQITKY